MNPSALAVHVVLAVSLLTIYTVLTLTGHGTDDILKILAGQGLGAGIQTATGSAGNAGAR